MTEAQKAMRRTNDVIRDAVARGVERKAALLLESGGTLSADEAANLLGIAAQELIERKSHLSLSMDNGDRVWPVFQFESSAMIHGVERVLAVIGVDAPWMQFNFFFLHLKELGGRTAVQAIREGSLEPVVVAARHFGNHGAS